MPPTKAASKTAKSTATKSKRSATTKVVAKQGSHLSPEYLAELRDVEAPHFSASGLQLQSSGTEFVLSLTRMKPLQEKSGNFAQVAKAEVVAIVSLSPGALKDMLWILAKAMSDHEKENGPVVTPFLRNRMAENGKRS
jgi:hypothetical protein